MSGPNMRLAALRRFALTITVLNLLGRTILGFENSWAQMFVALLMAYFTEIVLEIVDAVASKKNTAFYRRRNELRRFSFTGAHFRYGGLHVVVLREPVASLRFCLNGCDCLKSAIDR